MPWVLCALAGTAGSIGAYLLTASQVILDGLQTGIGQLYEEQRLVLARPLLGHKPVVLVRRQTILHPGGQGGHRDDFSCATAFGRIVVRLRGILAPQSLFYNHNPSLLGSYSTSIKNNDYFLISHFFLSQTNHNCNSDGRGHNNKYYTRTGKRLRDYCYFIRC